MSEVEFTAYEKNNELARKIVDEDLYVNEMFDLTTELFGDSATLRYIDGEYDSHRELISGGIDKNLLAP